MWYWCQLCAGDKVLVRCGVQLSGALCRDGKYHDIFENIGYFRYISDIFDSYV